MANDGKWLEKKVQLALQSFQTHHRSFFHRFPDTKAAKSWLPVQPGDYLWLLPEVPAILLEVKSTEKSAPLHSLLSAGQMGKHRLWLRAGHVTAFIYGDSSEGVLAWYPGEELLTTPKKANPSWCGSTDDVTEMFGRMAALLTSD